MSVLPAIASRRAAGRYLLWLVRCGVALLLFPALAGSPATGFAQEFIAPVKPIAQIYVDDDGRDLYYPSALFYDVAEEETYLVNGGTSRVVVYGPDYFPRVSIGAGRGITAPRGVFVTSDGQVYIPQGRNKSNPVQRLTILNGAFFVDREIILDQIPQAADIFPRQAVVNRDGLIYLVGETTRGVLVLDKDGNFLRWLQPMDVITDREAVAAAARKLEEEQQKALQQQAEEESEAPASTDEADAKRSRADIPEEFRPRGSRQEGEPQVMTGLGPVRVKFVHIDSTGRLYLISAETSRIYVYSPEETFLFAFGEKGGTPRKLSQPWALAIDEKRGLIYVVDYMRHTILVFDLAGKYLFEVGGRGNAPGWFNFPYDIAINRQGHIIVSELFNHRVQVLDVQYQFPVFKDQAPESTPESAGGDAETPPADQPGTPEADAAPEGGPAAEEAAQPDAAVEETIVPVQEIPGPADTVSEEQGVPAEAAEPATASAPEPSPAAEADEGQLPAEDEAQDAPAAEPEAAAPQDDKAGLQSEPEEAPAQADAVIEEQVIPEQALPVYPGEKQE